MNHSEQTLWILSQLPSCFRFTVTPNINLVILGFKSFGLFAVLESFVGQDIVGELQRSTGKRSGHQGDFVCRPDPKDSSPSHAKH